MKNIKCTLLSLTITSSLLFTACGHEHTFAEATCTTPKTCTECNEIEGEALGHNWLDATCENPMTCSVCNLIEGEPSDHEWIEATTEAPKTCEACGLTEGEPLPSSNIHVDSTGSDVTIDEGDYIEPSEEKQTAGVNYLDDKDKEVANDMREFYEAGLISEDEYNRALAILTGEYTIEDRVKEIMGEPDTSYEDSIAQEYNERAEAARASSTGTSTDLSQKIDYDGPRNQALAGYRIN